MQACVNDHSHFDTIQDEIRNLICPVNRDGHLSR